MTQYYCPEHKYNPPANSGLCFCPYCEFPEAYQGEDDQATQRLADAIIEEEEHDLIVTCSVCKREYKPLLSPPPLNSPPKT